MNEQRCPATGGIWIWLFVLLLLVTAVAGFVAIREHREIEAQLSAERSTISYALHRAAEYSGKVRQLEQRVSELEGENNELRKRLELTESPVRP